LALTEARRSVLSKTPRERRRMSRRTRAARPGLPERPTTGAEDGPPHRHAAVHLPRGADRLGVLKIPHPMANKRVVLPKLVKRRPAVLDKEKLRALFDRAHGTRLYPFVVLASATGCRRGELLALKWSDLNDKTGELSVSKSLEQTKAGLRVKERKGGEPRRFVVPEWALSVLADHRAEQENDKRLFGPDYQDGV
jgi:integrase